MEKIAAVVVTYNRLELLKQCVEKLRGQTVPCQIVLKLFLCFSRIF